jgi:putative acetyltransferase
MIDSTFTIRPIRFEDEAAVATIIRTCLEQFGLTMPGSAIHDPDVDTMFSSYQGPDRAYFVIDKGGKIVGGVGFAPLQGAESGVCALRKMYFLPEVRGLGLGKRALLLVIDAARDAGYRTLYLETVGEMTAAQGLYERCGFVRLGAPMGSTGHTPCTYWYALDLAR